MDISYQKSRFIVTLLLLVVMLASPGAGATTLKVITLDSLPKTCFKGSREDVVAMVDKAVLLLHEIGPEGAFHRYMLPDGGYVKGDLYVFVLSLSGTILANGASPGSVGSSALQVQDSHGHFFIKSILRQALSRGHGWVDYRWVSPCTGKSAAKSVYFRKTGPFVIGVGLYDAAEREKTSFRSRI